LLFFVGKSLFKHNHSYRFDGSVLVKEEQCSAPDEDEEKSWDNEQEEDDKTDNNR